MPPSWLRKACTNGRYPTPTRLANHQLLCRLHIAITESLCIQCRLQHHQQKKRCESERRPKGYWYDPANRRSFFEKLGKDLGITQLDDWYKIKASELRARGASALLKGHFNNSLLNALQSVYPDHPWDASRFVRAPPQFWSDINNHRQFFDHISTKLGIKQLDDWYRISVGDIQSLNGGSSILARHGSLLRALQAVYPDHPWDASRFAVTRRGLWKNPDYQRQFFDALAKDLGIQQLDDWHKVTVRQVRARGGGGLLARFGNSLILALQSAYPTHQWKQTNTTTNTTTKGVARGEEEEEKKEEKNKKPAGYWKDPKNQRAFLDQFAHDAGIQCPEDWYNKVTLDDVIAAGGTGLLSRHGHSLIRALRAVYPEHNWEGAPSKVPKYYWEEPANQRRFFDGIAKPLGIESLDAWYKVKVDQVKELGGAGLLQHYGDSLARALQAAYPEHAWKIWRFSRVPASTATIVADNHDSPLALAKEYAAELSGYLGIKSLDDWYRISLEQVAQFGGGHTIIKQNGGLYLFLKRVYPDHDWDESKFFDHTRRKASQRWLLLAVQKLFPNTEIMEEFQHPDLTFAGSNHKMEFDIFLPSLSIAFEYQGKHHYDEVFVFGSLSRRQAQDEEKLQACQLAGITLIRIPYWWDRTHESLAATVHAARPDLIPEPISLGNSLLTPCPQSGQLLPAW